MSAERKAGCDRDNIPGGIVYRCSRGTLVKPCAVAGCGRKHVALCDFPLTGKKAGQTCDRELCAYHRHTQSKLGADVDYCPTHHELAKGGAT